MVITSLLGAIPLVGPDILFYYEAVTPLMMSLCIVFIVAFYFTFCYFSCAILHMFFLHELVLRILWVIFTFGQHSFFTLYGIKDFYSIILSEYSSYTLFYVS